jgi:hypothetical protein
VEHRAPAAGDGVSDRETAIADLQALNIDSAELRWLAVRDYLYELGQGVSRQIKAIFLIAEFLDRCEANAFRRGEPMPGTFCIGFAPCWGRGDKCGRHQWGPKLIAADYLTARLLTVAPYKGSVRLRAIDILEPYMPPYLRKDGFRAGSL